MIILDQTIVNVALPSIQSDLRFSQSALAWVVNAYLIAFGGLLLLVGRLGDLIGRRRIFLAGLVVFTSASLVCGLADSQGLLIGARFIQGVGGAMTSAVILGMIVTMFPKPSERATAIGVYSFVAAAGGAIGLLAGGVLTQAINWHWIFFVNLPIGDRHRGPGHAYPALRPRHRPRARRGCAGCGAACVLADARRLHDRRGEHLRLGEPAHAGLRRARRGAAGGVHRPPGHRRQSADPAARVPLADGHGREPHADADGRGHLRDVLPRRALPPAGAALRRNRGRPGVPAGGARHRRAVAAAGRPADDAVRRQVDADRRPGPGCRGAAAVPPARPRTPATSRICCRRCCCSGWAPGWCSRR